mmetsp:Transcript_38624/g.84767  ORF Transcript_38624/g.84767 Transcript_38624/m.84767 type:complete len:216 (+) Transcript_38624:1237-1884(+)
MKKARFRRAFSAALRIALADARRSLLVTKLRPASRSRRSFLTRGKSITIRLKVERLRNQSSQSSAALAMKGLDSQCNRRQPSANESSASSRFFTLRAVLLLPTVIPSAPREGAAASALPLSSRSKISTVPFFTKYMPSAGVESVIIMYCLPKNRCSRDNISRRMKPDSQLAKKPQLRTIDWVIWISISDLILSGMHLLSIMSSLTPSCSRSMYSK